MRLWWLLLLVACMSVEVPSPYPGVTLLIRNESPTMVEIFDNMGRLATVYGGEAKCVRLRQPFGSKIYRFMYHGKLTVVESEYTIAFQPERSDGWLWTFMGVYENDVQSMVPYGQCEIGEVR